MLESREHVPSESLEEFAKKHLEKGREGWDIPHTLSVVHHARELATAAGVDVMILEAAAYLHDIGYPTLDKAGGSAAISDKKAFHMEEGARLAREFLERSENSAAYTSAQRDEIIRLVQFHDNLTALDTADLSAVVMMEADTLGMIDHSRATPTLSGEDGVRFIAGVERRRVPLFQTPLGRERLQTLLPIAKENFLRQVQEEKE